MATFTPPPVGSASTGDDRQSRFAIRGRRTSARSLNGGVDVIRLSADDAIILQQLAEHRRKSLPSDKREMPNAGIDQFDRAKFPHFDAILRAESLFELIRAVGRDFDQKFFRPMALVIKEGGNCRGWLLALPPRETRRDWRTRSAKTGDGGGSGRRNHSGGRRRNDGNGRKRRWICGWATRCLSFQDRAEGRTVSAISTAWRNAGRMSCDCGAGLRGYPAVCAKMGSGSWGSR